ncbi:alpha/beta hydrolase [Streptomyces sp. WAC 01529]|uniref:alpha/beta fold hydrolase n=1 Tax=Streptomyces sp. WAC 01529 TaxID=2203205 RepID=UPI000F6B9C06|nr:alpha/beta hydrolase [Streptomyces sp. WAC 01529]AZM57276.1 alpha/beta hydrolase [Streptomyces sp. WAC 01529]
MSLSTDTAVTVADTTLDYRGFRYLARTSTAGSSATEPLVVLGGSSQDRFSWMRYERWLLPHTTVVTLELPGYGGADALPVEHGMDFLADAVCHATEALALGRVNVFGACFGASIALRLAQRHPDHVARLMLGGTAVEISPEYTASARRWRRMVDDGQFDEMAQDMVEQFMAPPGHGKVRRQAAVARLMRQRFACLTARELAMDITHHERLLTHPWSLPGLPVSAPVLVFTGEHDTITPPEVGRRVAADLGARFTTITESDHLVQIERDSDLADLMAHFFTDRALDQLPYLNPVEHFTRT